MKIELSSEQLKACSDALKCFHRSRGYQDEGIGALATKFYELWQHSIHQGKEEEEVKLHETETKQNKDCDATPGVEGEKQKLQQRVPSPLHASPEGEGPCGPGPGRPDPGRRDGPSDVHGEVREIEEAKDQDSPVRDGGGSESGSRLTRADIVQWRDERVWVDLDFPNQILALFDEHALLKKKEQLSFESMVDHHEAETVTLNDTIKQQAAVVKAAKRAKKWFEEFSTFNTTAADYSHWEALLEGDKVRKKIAKALAELEEYPRPERG